LDVLKQSFLGTGEIPMCRDCGGLVKVATISFGQAMPEEVMRLAEIETLAADLFIVLGSSLVVFPAAGFPVMAKRNGANLVIVNRDPTDMDDIADLVLNTDIGPVMTAVAPAD
jgi:NAD-dependent deacetylase